MNVFTDGTFRFRSVQITNRRERNASLQSTLCQTILLLQAGSRRKYTPTLAEPNGTTEKGKKITTTKKHVDRRRGEKNLQRRTGPATSRHPSKGITLQKRLSLTEIPGARTTVQDNTERPFLDPQLFARRKLPSQKQYKTFKNEDPPLSTFSD